MTVDRKYEEYAANMLQWTAEYFSGRTYEWWVNTVKSTMIFIFMVMIMNSFYMYFYSALLFLCIFPAVRMVAVKVDEAFGIKDKRMGE